ncbi:MAG: DUF4386 domain-containing protein [Anaerolineaceae bacterium]|nr:DUF4386 domain-containing protein [Anaerolineaceae bacterium]
MKKAFPVSYRATAVIVGLLFIIGTVGGILSGLVTGPILGAPDILAEAAGNQSQMTLGSLLILVMGFPLAMIPAVLYPIFKQQNQILALGALVFRGVLEAVTYMVMAACWLLLVSVGQAYVNAGAADMGTYQVIGSLLTKTVYFTEHLLALVFTIGAMMLYWLFIRARLVPGWLAWWGFIGAVLYFAAPILNLFDTARLPLSLGVKWGYLMIPLAIQEMVFALWMIIKGFNKTDHHAEEV